MQLTPLTLITAAERRFPGVWRWLSKLEALKASGRDNWPDYCPLPISAAAETLRVCYHATPALVGEYAAELVACYAWRRSRIVYRFSPELASTLAAQAEALEDTDVLPAELLLHLPYPCVYVQCPGVLDEYVDGFFAWAEYDSGTNTPELRIQYAVSTGINSVPGMLHLITGGTIGECIADTNRTISANAGRDLASSASEVRMILGAIQMLLYLASEGAETTARPSPRRKPGKGKGRTAAPKAPKTIDVGIRIGAALRAAKSAPRRGSGSGAGTGSAKRAHSRRGHWHHYWVGPKNSPERRLVLRWTAPTFIHGDAAQGVTIYPVKEG